MLRENVAHGGRGLARAGARSGRLRTMLGAYLSLTKPRIISLLLVTTLPAMILAEGGMPSGWLVLFTLAGGTLAAGGANAINCYLDRDIDLVMLRTRERPLPAGVVSPAQALTFGLAMGVAGFAVLAAGANLLAASLATGALAFYVFVYTVWLKRSSPQNIVIGGAAGGVPPLAGWAAVTGDLTWTPLLLFAIVCIWTPPHFWALALRYRSDYARAGVPMLPVVRGVDATKRQIALYSVVLVAVSLLLVPVAAMGLIYATSAAALGAPFLYFAYRVWRDDGSQASRALFLYSIAYLGLLFVAAGADGLVR